MSNTNGQITAHEIITPEEYEANRIQLAAARQLLQHMESANAMKLQSWHELQQRIADGERAKQELEALQRQSGSGLVPMPPLPAPFQQDQQVIPTTATIEELPSQPSPANPTASESHYRSHAVTNNAQTYHASPNQPTHQSYYPSHMYQQSRSINSTQAGSSRQPTQPAPPVSSNNFQNVYGNSNQQSSSSAIAIAQTQTKFYAQNVPVAPVASAQQVVSQRPPERQTVMRLAFDAILMVLQTYTWQNARDSLNEVRENLRRNRSGVGDIGNFTQMLQKFHPAEAWEILDVLWKHCETLASVRGQKPSANIQPQNGTSVQSGTRMLPTSAATLAQETARRSATSNIQPPRATAAPAPQQQLASTASASRIPEMQRRPEVAHNVAPKKPPPVVPENAGIREALQIIMSRLQSERRTNAEVGQVFLAVYRSLHTHKKPEDPLALWVTESLKRHHVTSIKIALEMVLNGMKIAIPIINPTVEPSPDTVNRASSSSLSGALDLPPERPQLPVQAGIPPAPTVPAQTTTVPSSASAPAAPTLIAPSAHRPVANQNPNFRGFVSVDPSSHAGVANGGPITHDRSAARGTTGPSTANVDRSRLAHNILKELGMPVGTMPVVKTKREAEAEQRERLRLKKKQWEEALKAAIQEDTTAVTQPDHTSGGIQHQPEIVPKSVFSGQQTSVISGPEVPASDLSEVASVQTAARLSTLSIVDLTEDEVQVAIQRGEQRPIPLEGAQAQDSAADLPQEPALPDPAPPFPVISPTSSVGVMTPDVEAMVMPTQSPRAGTTTTEEVKGTRPPSVGAPSDETQVPAEDLLTRTSPPFAFPSDLPPSDLPSDPASAATPEPAALISPFVSPKAVPIPKARSHSPTPLFLVSDSDSESEADTIAGAADRPSSPPLSVDLDIDRGTDATIVSKKPVSNSSSNPILISDSEEEFVAEVLKSSPKRLLKRKRFYIDVPPLPEWTRKKRAREYDSESDEDYEELQLGAEDRAILDACFSRLRPCRCRWRECDAMLNCVNSLCKHIITHVNDREGSHSFKCHWQDCTRRFGALQSLEGHVMSHAKNPIRCAHQGCKKAFHKPRHLLDHNMTHSDDFLKPSTSPSDPKRTDAVGPLPTTIPSYLAIPIPLIQASITPERHSKLGPWVLRNIYGPINTKGLQYNAATPLRNARRPDRSSADDVSDAAESKFKEMRCLQPDRYEFLDKITTKPSALRFEELSAEQVSRDVNDGLVLFWGDDDSEDRRDSVVIVEDLSETEDELLLRGGE